MNKRNKVDDFMNTEQIMSKAESLFFVGIGGVSMSSLAFVCRELGYAVRGSDRAYSAMTERLESEGIAVIHKHEKENIEGADAVVYTGAVSMDNPELSAAAEKEIPLIYRADLLGYLMKSYTHRVGVAGMHGKSTCTSMISHMFLASGRKPTVLSGAETAEMGGAYTIGEKEYFIFEACEYKDSFLRFFPSVSVLLNLDLDHTDYFTGGIPQIQRSFGAYGKLPYASDSPVQLTVANADDENLMAALSDIPLLTFGIEADADFAAGNIEMKKGRASFCIYKKGEFFTDVQLSVPGYHNIYNALAAAAVGDALGLCAQEIAQTLSSFTGLLRRFEYKGDLGGASVYIDYAHHPKEIHATVRAAKEMTEGKLLCFFEPHTYSRTAALFSEFSEAFDGADAVYYLDIYAAREDNIFGVSSAALANATKNGAYVPSYEDAVNIILSQAAKDDTILILGAGTVNRIADMLFEKH